MLLKAEMGEAGGRVPTGIMPDWVIWLASFLKPDLRQLVPILGKTLAASNLKARWETLLAVQRLDARMIDLSGRRSDRVLHGCPLDD